ncbi:retrotransposable element Tf2 [Tanacetum coccineum]
MRVYSHVGKYKIHILIDSGSTHNFIDTSTAKRIGCGISAIVPLQVDVADGNKLLSTLVCRKFTWLLQGETFVTDAMLVPLGGCEMVLRVQWLATLGNIQWKFSKLKMAFEYKGKTITLRGIQKSTLQWMQGKKMSQTTAELSSMMLCVYPVSNGLDVPTASFSSFLLVGFMVPTGLLTVISASIVRYWSSYALGS